MTVKHTTQTTKPNDGTKDVSANAWNENHTITPDTIAHILSDHNKAAHDALGINADTLDGTHAVGFAPALGADDNYVTDAEKTVIGNTSGTNTGDASGHTGLVPTSRTVNSKALSADITLGLASADFVNQGTTTTVLHGNAAGNPAFGAVGTNDITTAAVTYAKIQNVSATDKLLGRATVGAGSVEEIALTAAGRAILDDVDAAAQRTTLELTAGGAGDIWVEKAGDTMTGALSITTSDVANVPTLTVTQHDLDGRSAIDVQNDGTGNCLHMNQTGNGVPLQIVNNGTANSITVEGTTSTDFTVAKSGAVNIGGALTLGTDLAVADGGTGRSVTVAYTPICGGTTTTAAMQSVASIGSAGQVLTSNGAGALPTFQAAAGGAQTAAIWLGAESAYLPATAPAVFNEVAGATTYAGWSYLAFDDTTSQTAVWRVPVPKYNDGNITVTAFSKPQTTPAGNVTLQYNILTIGLADNEDFNTAALTDTTVNISHSLGTGSLSTEVVKTSGTIDPANVTADDMLLIGIQRDVATDDLAGNGHLLGILIEYTKV